MGKVAIVTGSSMGIGRAIAEALASSKEYSGIVTNSRNLEEALQVSEGIKRLGCDSIAIEADMSREADCVRLVNKSAKHYGRIDVLVNNAGVQDEARLEETSTEQWRRIIGIDLTGPFVCSREAVRHMLSQKPKGGCIVNVSSVHRDTQAALYPVRHGKSGHGDDDKDDGARAC